MKQVLLVIQVPDGDHCFCFSGPGHEICSYFDNERGYARCILPVFSNIREEEMSVQKDPKCLALEDK